MTIPRLWTAIATRTLSGREGWVQMPNANVTPDEARAEKAMGRLEISEIKQGRLEIMRVRAVR